VLQHIFSEFRVFRDQISLIQTSFNLSENLQTLVAANCEAGFKGSVVITSGLCVSLIVGPICSDIVSYDCSSRLNQLVTHEIDRSINCEIALENTFTCYNYFAVRGVVVSVGLIFLSGLFSPSSSIWSLAFLPC